MTILCEKCGKTFSSPDHTAITTCEECETEIGEGLDELEIRTILERRGEEWILNILTHKEII